MATAIRAIPTLKGKEAREFLRHAEEAERNYKGTNNRDDHSFCQMAHAILSKAGLSFSERECNATLCTFRSENELERSSRS